MAIHEARTKESLLKSFASLSIPKCPTELDKFSAWHLKFKTELGVFGLYKYFQSSFTDILLDVYRTDFQEKIYSYERRFLILSEFDPNDVDSMIFTNDCFKRDYDGGTELLNREFILEGWDDPEIDMTE